MCLIWMGGLAMNKLCDRFDLYQDGDLSPEEQDRFSQHMATCTECGNRHHLLHNIAQALTSQKLPESHPGSKQISRTAYQRLQSWDVLSFYLPRPAKAWTVFAFLVMGTLSFWLLPPVQEPDFDAEYEMLMTDINLVSTNQNTLINPTDDEIIRWLEQGGEIQ